MTPLPSNEEKERLWERYRAGRPERVPVILSTNDRVYLLDPRYNVEGLTYDRAFADPEQMLLAQLHWQELVRSHHHRYCDYPAGLPEQWEVGVAFQNVSEAWFFGCPLDFHPGQVPDTRPILHDDNKRAVFAVDIDHPLARDPYRRGIELCERMMELARHREYRGRPIKVLPYLPTGSDGPVTVALNLRGAGFLLDLALDPDYASELMAFIVQAAINRARAVLRYWGRELHGVGLADDGIEALSQAMYREQVLPHHRRFYDALDPEHRLPRSMHLCGDDGRHFPVIVRELGVRSLDTGFPLDFAWLRQAVGPEVEIVGGVEVATLLHGGPAEVYARAREILTSGVLAGRRFVLREANNLPPGVPEENLAAMYQAAFDYGCYEAG